MVEAMKPEELEAAKELLVVEARAAGRAAARGPRARARLAASPRRKDIVIASASARTKLAANPARTATPADDVTLIAAAASASADMVAPRAAQRG